MKDQQHPFGDEVRRLRTAKGVGLRQMAEEVGISPAYLSQLERGVSPPPDEKKVKKIAKALRVKQSGLMNLAQEDRSQAMLAKWATLSPSLVKWAGEGESSLSSLMFWLRLSGGQGELQRVLEVVKKEIVTGLQHGEFEFSISGERAKTGKHHLRIKAGRVHRFEVPDAELAGEPAR